MNILWIVAVFGIKSSVSRHVGGISNSTRKRSSEDYYQINYDYEILNNNTLDVEFSSDSLILPIPDESMVRDSKNVDKTEKILNGDLKEHDLIDNLMYIYNKESPSTAPGRQTGQLIIAGCVLGTAIQFSIILLILLRIDTCNNKDLKELFLHLMFSLCVANVAFVFGVFKTKYSFECLTIALALTYFHLMASVWIFIYCFNIYKVFCRKENVERKYYLMCGYGLPLLFSLGSFLIAPQTYETRKFCFMSAQKGMIMNYMVPIFCLLILTAVYCIKGIRILNMEMHTMQANSNLDAIILYNNQMEVVMDKQFSNPESWNLRALKSCLSRLCALQTTFDIVWFLLVLALDNIRDSEVMSIVYCLSCCLLNSFIFSNLQVFLPTLRKPKMKEATTEVIPKQCNVAENMDLSPAKSEFQQGSSDSVPLLIETTELKILYHNPKISTISS